MPKFALVLVLTLSFGLMAFGVGCSNACDDAVDKLEECGLDTNTSGSNVDTDDCDDQAECASECIEEASCDEIKSMDINSNYMKCIMGCA